MKNFLSKLNPFSDGQSSTKTASASTSSAQRYYDHSGATGGAKYPGGLSNHGYSSYIGHTRTRQNARHAFHDVPEAKSLVTRFADTVVDTGLTLECTPEAEILGITDEEAEQWARDVERRFHLWARSKKCDRRGVNNFYQMQRLYQIGQQRDNDIFVRLYYSNRKDLSNPLQLSILDPNQIKGDTLTSTYYFSSPFDGIKRNSKGEEISYSVCVKDYNDGQIKFTEVPRIGERSKRVMMLHGFATEYAGQTRGYSRLQHVLQEFEELADFKISAIKKAIANSQINMYVKPSSNKDASNPFADMAEATGPVAGPFGSDGDSTASSDDLPMQEAVDPVHYHSLVPQAEMSIPGNVGVFNLEKGEELKAFPGDSHSDPFNEFIESYMSYISASMGMPNEVNLMKFGQNYSASRGALLLFWRVVGIWRGEMKSDFLDPSFEAWLSEEIAAGRISAPGFSDPILRQAWLSCDWIGAPMPNIDPQRTAKADMAYAEMGATTLDRISRNLNGSDGASNRRKLEREFDELPHAKWNKTAPTDEELSEGDGE